VVRDASEQYNRGQMAVAQEQGLTNALYAKEKKRADR
jgi:hypothetical protein